MYVYVTKSEYVSKLPYNNKIKKRFVSQILKLDCNYYCMKVTLPNANTAGNALEIYVDNNFC